jgi:hypothetical protein
MKAVIAILLVLKLVDAQRAPLVPVVPAQPIAGHKPAIIAQPASYYPQADAQSPFFRTILLPVQFPVEIYEQEEEEQPTTTVPPTTTTTQPKTSPKPVAAPILTCGSQRYQLPTPPQSKFYSCCGQNVIHWPSTPCGAQQAPEQEAEAEPETTPAPTTTAAPAPIAPTPVRVSCSGAVYTIPAPSMVVNYGCCGTKLQDLNNGARCNSEQTPVQTTLPPTTLPPTTVAPTTAAVAPAAATCPSTCTCCNGFWPIYDPTKKYRCCPGYGPYNPVAVRCPTSQ